MTMMKMTLMRTTTMDEITPHPLLLRHPCPYATYCCPRGDHHEEEENHAEMVPEHEAPEELEIIALIAEPEPPQPRLYIVLMRDYEESPSRMMDNLDDLDDPTEADYDVNEWFPKDGSND
jgi:hypothetical protein